MAEKDKLAERLEKIEVVLARLGINVEAMLVDEKEPTTMRDYIEFGSPAHADLLGLRKATSDDGVQLEGWTLQDMTAFGPQATENYVREVLRQKVSELKAGKPTPPKNAPSMWRPPARQGSEVTGIAY